ncbi:MAG TPA: hypothetical protein PLZ67_09030, partial [Bacteroidales bacterium]|nr:hypothetical protein [Bacteroidales bacterium]
QLPTLPGPPLHFGLWKVGSEFQSDNEALPCSMPFALCGVRCALRVVLISSAFSPILYNYFETYTNNRTNSYFCYT